MKIRRLVMVAACLTSVAGAALLHGAVAEADANKAALQQQLNEVLKQRIESADRAREAMQAGFEAETVVLTDLVHANNQLVEAEVAGAIKPKEEIAALEKHVARTKQLEERIEGLFNAGARGGEEKEYYTAKRERESAEVLLIKARIRANQ